MSSLVLKRASAYQFVDTANRPWPTCVARVFPQASAKIAGTLSAHGSLYASGTLPPLGSLFSGGTLDTHGSLTATGTLRGSCVRPMWLALSWAARNLVGYPARSQRDLKMPNPKDDPKSPEWRPYIFARDQWHCRICGHRSQRPHTVRKHTAHAHDENIPPSMYECFRGAVWHRKKIP